MRNALCVHGVMLSLLIIGFVTMMIGLTMIPNPPTRQVLGTTEEPPVDRTAIIVGSYGFRLSIGGAILDILVILVYSYIVWRENRDVATVQPIEPVIKPILKKGPVIEVIHMRPKTARSAQPEGLEEPSRIAHSLAYSDDQTVSPV